MKIYISIIILVWNILFYTDIVAQISLEAGSSGATRDGALIVYGTDGQKSRIPYTKITGNAFSHDQWNLADLYLHRGKLFGHYQARLNLATHELHFLRKGEELVAPPELIEKVIFYKGTDTTQILSIFRNDFPEINHTNKGSLKYVQELNQGKAVLLKMTQKIVQSADSLFGTMKRYYFKTEQKYFLRLNQKTDPLKKMNKENLFAILPAAHQFEIWIKENKIRFSNENDIIKFLDYYNVQVHTQ